MATNAPTAYTKPRVFEKGEGNLKFMESRHPCLEVQDDIIFMANDIVMEKGISEFQIISVSFSCFIPNAHNGLMHLTSQRARTWEESQPISGRPA